MLKNNSGSCGGSVGNTRIWGMTVVPRVVASVHINTGSGSVCLAVSDGLLAIGHKQRSERYLFTGACLLLKTQVYHVDKP